MRKQINEKIKANYMTLFYIGLALLFCVIFKEEFIGETGLRITSGILGVFGYLGYVAIGALVVFSFAKVVFNFRLFKAKTPALYVLTVLFIMLLTAIIDVFEGESFAYGGIMSQYLLLPFKTLFGNVGTTVIFIILEVVVTFFLVVRVLALFGINVFNTTKKDEKKNRVQWQTEETEAESTAENLRIEKAKSPKQIEIAAASTLTKEITDKEAIPEIVINDMTVILPSEINEQETASGITATLEILDEVSEEHSVTNESEEDVDILNERESTSEQVCEDKAYVPPKLSNFKSEDMSVQRLSESELYDNASTITSVLAAIKIEAKVTDVIIGTSIIRYEVAVQNSADIVRVERARKALLSRLQIDALTIEAPILGKDRVGINMPNPYRQTVSLKRLLEDKKFQTSTNTTVALGREITGGAVLCDLAKMPHMLIAGSTGMGKSVCLNSMIVSLLFHANPQEVKLILIDPKRVEFNIYRGIPHLLRDIVSEADETLEVLSSAVDETERRYKLFATNNARDIDSYNLGTKKKLPKIIIIIDELAELMSGDLKKEIESQIQRLAQKARAAGVHLVVATQRPSVDVITGVIKSNLPSRIAFKLSNGVDSKTILDENGAEDLLGKGDMFYKPSNFSEKLRVQGAFVTTDEIKSIVKEIEEHRIKQDKQSAKIDCGDVKIETLKGTEAKQGFDNIDYNIVKISSSEEDVEAKQGFDNSDDIDTKTVVTKDVETKLRSNIKDLIEVSVGEVQRICQISYSKAFEMLKQLEAQGLVEQIDEEKYIVVN